MTKYFEKGTKLFVIGKEDDYIVNVQCNGWVNTTDINVWYMKYYKICKKSNKFYNTVQKIKITNYIDLGNEHYLLLILL